MLRAGLVGLVMCSVSGGLVLAADDDAAMFQKVVEQSARKYTEAFAKRDVAALGALFTAEAEYVDPDGVVFHGRKVIEAEYAASFAANPPGKVAIELTSIRPIATGVLVEEGTTTFIPDDKSLQVVTPYSVIHVQQKDGTWLMASVRELAPAELTAHDRLQSLAWLIGAWHEEVDGNVVSSEWKWSDDGNFLVSTFSIRLSAATTYSGTHRIGWDAARKQFRSWIFDATGGSAEGWWLENEDGSWSVQIQRVDDAGTRSSSRMTYTPAGKDAIQVMQDQIVRDGVSVADVNTHRIVRRPPAPLGTESK